MYVLIMVWRNISRRCE